MADTSKIVDKRVYKGTFPTCHDFNKVNVSSSSCLLLIGFSAGQIQLIDPQQKELPNSKLFNEERQIDRTAVTCLRWVPDGRSFFVASHASGNLYVRFIFYSFYFSIFSYIMMSLILPRFLHLTKFSNK